MIEKLLTRTYTSTQTCSLGAYDGKVKTRKLEQRFFEILIRNKFGIHWIQIRGPLYELFEHLSFKHTFLMHKRNISLRRFFYASNTYV